MEMFMKKMEQVYPISKRMKKYFESSVYSSIVRQNYKPDEYKIDWGDDVLPEKSLLEKKSQ